MTTFPTPSTPFPNDLLDAVLPTLKDTEWRLLCVIVRQTLGWRGERAGERKTSDWLTHGQLKARTGRSSEAVSHALDTLVQRELIEVWSDEGLLLVTPAARRRVSGRLNFRLGPQAMRNQEGRKPKEDPTGEDPISKNEDPIPKSEIGKAKTTKETSDKRSPIGEERLCTGRDDRPHQEHVRESSEVLTEISGTEVHRFLKEYRRMFAERSARGEPPPISWGRDSKLVKGLLAQYGYVRLRELLEQFFRSQDPWVAKCGFTLSCFPHILPQLLMAGRDRSGMHQKSVVSPKETEAPWKRAETIAVSDTSLFERYPELARRIRGPSPES